METELNLHKVGNMDFNLSCAGVYGDRFSDHSELHALKAKLLETVEVVFSELCPPHATYIIPNLELSIDISDPNDFSSALYKALSKKCRELIDGQSHHNGMTGSTTITMQQDLEIMLFFLKNGYFPWSASSGIAASRISFFNNFIKTQSRSFIKYLSKIGSLELLLERFVHQCPSYLLNDFFEQLISQHLNFTYDRQNTFFSYWSPEKKKILQGLLKTILRSDAITTWAALLKDCAIQASIEYREIYAYCSELCVEKTGKKIDRESQRKESLTDCDELALFIRALREKNKSLLTTLWPYLVLELPQQLVHTIQTLPDRQKVVAVIIDLFSESQFIELLELFDCDDSLSMSTLLKELQSFASSTYADNITITTSMLRQYFLQIVLDTKERSQHSGLFIKSILEHISSGGSVPYRTLLGCLFVYQQKKSEFEEHSELLSLLHCLLVHENGDLQLIKQGQTDGLTVDTILESLRKKDILGFAKTFDLVYKRKPQLADELFSLPSILTLFPREVTSLLPRKTVDQMITLLEPKECETLCSVLDSVEQEEHPLGESSFNDYAHAVDIIISFLLANRGSHFNNKSFMSSYITSLAAHFNLKVLTVIGHVQKQLKKSLMRQSKVSNLLELLSEMLIEEKASSVQDVQIIPGNIGRVYTLQEFLLSIKLYGNSPLWIKQFIAKNEDYLKRFFSTSDALFFKEVQDLLQGVDTILTSAQIQKCKTYLYEITIPYIIKKSRLNKAFLLNSLVKEMAKEGKVSLTNFYHILLQLVIKQNCYTVRPFFETLITHKRAQRNSLLLHKLKLAPQIQLRIFAAFLHDGVLPPYVYVSQKEYLNAIEPFITSEHFTIERLSQLIPTETMVAKKLSALHTEKTLRHIVHLLLQKSGSISSLFMQSVSDIAKGLSNKAYFYAAILECVLKNKPIDLLKLEEESRNIDVHLLQDNYLVDKPLLFSNYLYRLVVESAEHVKNETISHLISQVLSSKKSHLSTFVIAKMSESTFRKSFIQHSNSEQLEKLFFQSAFILNSLHAETIRALFNTIDSRQMKDSSFWNTLFSALISPTLSIEKLIEVLFSYASESPAVSGESIKTIIEESTIDFSEIIQTDTDTYNDYIRQRFLTALDDLILHSGSSQSKEALMILIQMHGTVATEVLRFHAKRDYYVRQLSTFFINGELYPLFFETVTYHVSYIHEVYSLFKKYLQVNNYSHRVVSLNYSLLSYSFSHSLFSKKQFLKEVIENIEQETETPKITFVRKVYTYLSHNKVSLSTELSKSLKEHFADSDYQPSKSVDSSDPMVDTFDKDTIYIRNAGLIILAPYLPRLFEMFQFLEDGEVKYAMLSKAVHSLQFLVTGETETPEEELVLNKILCGVPVDSPVSLEVTLSDSEKETLIGLLTAIKTHWTKMSGSSIDTLQEMFLQREGTLLRDNGQWILAVLPGTFDMLMGSIPWGYSTVKLSWMSDTVFTEW